MKKLEELLNLMSIYEKQGMSINLPVVFTNENGEEYDFTGIVNEQDRISIAIKKI